MTKGFLCRKLKVHDPGSKHQKPVQTIRVKLPSEQEANIRLPTIILAIAAAISQPLQKLRRHPPSLISGRVRPSPRPVSPHQGPIRVHFPEFDANESG